MFTVPVRVAFPFATGVAIIESIVPTRKGSSMKELQWNYIQSLKMICLCVKMSIKPYAPSMPCNALGTPFWGYWWLVIYKLPLSASFWQLPAVFSMTINFHSNKVCCQLQQSWSSCFSISFQHRITWCSDLIQNKQNSCFLSFSIFKTYSSWKNYKCYSPSLNLPFSSMNRRNSWCNLTTSKFEVSQLI